MNKIKFDELKWVCVDFDNCICNNSGYPEYVPTTVIGNCKEVLKQITNRGFKVVIYTARPYSDYQMIENFLDDNELEYRRIICGKPLARYIIDDRNIEFSGNWDNVFDKIK